MGAMTFEQLKQSRAKDFERLRQSIGFKSGTHKRKRLVQSVGVRVAKRTILDSATHIQHQDKLFKRFQKAWGSLTDQQARERLRFLTILDTVCVVETTAILHAVEQMEGQLRCWLPKETKQFGILGVAEVEILNLGLYGEQGTEEEARKGQVLFEMVKKTGMKGAGTIYSSWSGKEHLALVHFHGIVDLGPQAAIMEKKLHAALRKVWKGSWCVELKGLFTTLSMEKNLRNLAGYLTKGGNDTLRFRKQFGNGSPESMELAMAKQGYAESGEYDDHLGLSVGEVSVLVHVYDALMRRNNARDGYLFLGGTVARSRYQSHQGYRIWKSALATGIKPFG